MTADVRINVGMPAHPKTKKLIRRLGTDAAWRLICLIAWVAGNRPDGDLASLSNEDIELCVDWPGEDGAFAKALVDVGFMDGEEGSYRLHDWQDHNPWAFWEESRSEKAKWAAIIKHHGKEEAIRAMPEYAAKLAGKGQALPAPAARMPSSATSMPLAESSSAPSPYPSPYPLPDPYPSPSPSPDPQPTGIPDRVSSKAGEFPPIVLKPRGSSAKRTPLADNRPPAPGKQQPPGPGTVERNFSKSGTLAEVALAEIQGAARRGGP